MEAVSFSLGVVALASLFSTCVECFDYVQLAKTHGRDYEILSTRLDVEKTLLLQWGSRVGLLSEGTQDARLGQPDTRATVERVLNCIRMLLTDADDLRAKYGLEPAGTFGGTAEGVAKVSASRMYSFADSYSRFLSRVGKKQKETALSSKTRWAIHDRKKFAALIEDLGQFVSRLDNLLPANGFLQQQLIKEDVEALGGDLSALQLVRDACKDTHTAWSDAATARVEATEMSSSDRRGIEEWLQDTLTMGDTDEIGVSTPTVPDLPADLTDFLKESTGVSGLSAVDERTSRSYKAMVRDTFRGPYVRTAMIASQMEFYFSTSNLNRDRFIRRHMDQYGFVPLGLIANFPLIKMLTDDINLIRRVCGLVDSIELGINKAGSEGVRKRDDWQNWIPPANRKELSPDKHLNP